MTVNRLSISFHMQDTFYSEEKNLIAIIFCEPVDPLSGKKALRYKAYNTPSRGVRPFMEFAAKFPTAKYVNFYSKTTRLYCGRVYIHR